jgi:SAM-dependent methyltransferase
MSGSGPAGDYTIPSDWGGEDERLRLLGEWRDPITLARMERLGLAPGWRCLEVGVGSGSTARAMAERVGATGQVTAADINAGFLANLAGVPGVLARHCDIRRDDFPPASFDLIHTRLVLEHLPDRQAVMRRMADWLAPGGWLLFEEPDTAAAEASPNRLWARHFEAYAADPGYDVRAGRVLAAEVASLGLADVGLEIDTTVVRGGTDVARWYAMTIDAVRSGLTSPGLLNDDDLDRVIESLNDPALLEPGFTFHAVWARKPPLKGVQ